MNDIQAGQLLLLIGAVLGLAGVVTGAVFSRKTGREGINVQGFEANIKAFDIRATSAEKAAAEAYARANTADTRAGASEDRLKDLESRFTAMEDQLAGLTKDNNRIRQIVQSWFKKLQNWNENRASGDSGAHDPMPLPTTEEMTLLGLQHTQPAKP